MKMLVSTKFINKPVATFFQHFIDVGRAWALSPYLSCGFDQPLLAQSTKRLYFLFSCNAWGPLFMSTNSYYISAQYFASIIQSLTLCRLSF